MKLVYGKGINDSTEPTEKRINGKRVICPFYETWRGMLKRCYSDKCLSKHPTYVGCTVCDEWLYFSKFKSWMQSQDYNNKPLDKDLLVQDNKIYSPDTCVFVSREINNFLTTRAKVRGDYPIGVSLSKTGKYVSQLRENGKLKYFGSYDTPMEAHYQWQINKILHAEALIAKTDDARVAGGLMRIIQQIKNDIEKGEETTKL